MHVQPIVPQGGGRVLPIVGMHHQAPRKYADTTLEDAHIYVHFKAVYTLALKQRLSEGNCGHIGGAQQLFHNIGVGSQSRFVERPSVWPKQK